MEFIKHNLGFLIFAVFSVALLGGMGFIWGSASKKEKDFADKVKQQQNFMSQVQRREYSLTQPNVEIARQNQQLAKQQFQDFLLTLAVKYGIKIEVTNGLECVRILKDECLRIQEELTSKGIQLSNETGYFSFDSITRSSVIPTPDEVVLILKNLWVIKEVMRLTGKSGVTGFSKVVRPAGLRFIDKGSYSLMPLELVVSGGYKSIQRLINLLHTEANGIFILRSVSLEAKDQAAGGRIAALSAAGQSPAGGNEMMGGMPLGMMPGMDPMMGVQPGGARAGTKTAATVKAGTGKDRVTLLDLDREQRVVFGQHEVNAVIIVDFIEFKKPPEEK